MGKYIDEMVTICNDNLLKSSAIEKNNSMKLIVFLAAIFISITNSSAQMGSWTIKLNNKKVISTAKEDEKANCKKLKISDWNKNGNLEILYKESEPNTWIRSFLFYDEDDNEIKRIDSTTHSTIPIKQLRNLFQGKKKLIIYTVIAPVDPSIAIRIRRVHLCTLLLP